MRRRIVSITLAVAVTLGAGVAMDAKPILLAGMTNEGGGSWLVVFKYTAASLPTGAAVGKFMKFRALAASTTGPVRIRELAGAHIITNIAVLPTKQFTVRIFDRSLIGLDAANLPDATASFTDVRVNRCVLNFQITGTAADQGGFTLRNGVSLEVDNIAVMGNRTAVGVPTNTPTTAGSAATAGFLLYPDAHLKGGENLIVAGWGGYGIQMLSGSSLDWLDGAIQNCYQNGVYGQQNCTINMARSAITSCHISAATTLASHGQFPDSVMALSNYGEQTISGSTSSFTGGAHIGSNIVGHHVDAGRVMAESAVDLLNLNNTTAVALPETGQIEYLLNGAVVHQINYVGTVGGLPANVSPGLRLMVTDSNATLAAGLGNVVAGGGANRVPVYGDVAGGGWRIG